MTSVPEAHCTVESCSLPTKALGLCNRHYLRQRSASRPCEVSSCNNPYYARGLCKGHWNAAGMSSKVCTVEGCSKPHKGRGYCSTHYDRMRSTGSTDAPKVLTPEERIEAKREREREHYKNNKGRYRERQTKWRQDNPEKIRVQNHRRRARKYAVASDNHTVKDVLELYGADCHLCGEPIDLNAPRRATDGPGWERGLQEDHVIPLSKGGTHTLDNCRPSHGLCNLKKGAKL